MGSLRYPDDMKRAVPPPREEPSQMPKDTSMNRLAECGQIAVLYVELRTRNPETTALLEVVSILPDIGNRPDSVPTPQCADLMQPAEDLVW